ncbi:hypothetical protein ASF84_02115 [Pseudomonas sp. Leaf127]|uniref:DUF4303 domain-containing protein n=1 Tax=Pseudomonas sp. Leaf127 TaxID=1736267 RepID=UPI000703ABA0|nr:DUF4303 domain-containing protein [Pseudomonas sp. Leaf127]KQQ67954.1 hypothetical protein ASF84_02115 [Pseudomonas sp. Leaf127]
MSTYHDRAMNWQAFEQHMFDSARQALHAHLDQAGAPLYAAAFHGSYREEEAVLSLPSLAFNSLQALDEDFADETDQSFSSVKWNPADWRHDLDIEYATPALLALDETLQAFANRAGPRQWRHAERRFMVSVARAARALGAHFAGHPGVTADFVVIFHDFDGDIGLARRSISRQQFESLFPVELAIETTLKAVATQSEAEQAAFYLGRLHRVDGVSGEVAEPWLIAHGAAAQQGLIEQLMSKKDATPAARILGLAGRADPVVIDALRQQALRTRQAPLRNWCASALGYLGDFDWLIEQAQEVAVSGFCAPFDSFRRKGARRPVLDYAPLQRLLEQRPEWTAMIEDTLGEQNGGMDGTPADVSEALRGLGVSQVAIRRHAVEVLNHRDLEEADWQRAVQGLRAAQADEDERVRERAHSGLAAMTVRPLPG